MRRAPCSCRRPRAAVPSPPAAPRARPRTLSRDAAPDARVSRRGKGRCALLALSFERRIGGPASCWKAGKRSSRGIALAAQSSKALSCQQRPLRSGTSSMCSPLAHLEIARGRATSPEGVHGRSRSGRSASRCALAHVCPLRSQPSSVQSLKSTRCAPRGARICARDGAGTTVGASALQLVSASLGPRTFFTISSS